VGSRPRLLSQQPLNVQRALPQWARIGSVAGTAADAFYTDAAGVKWRYVQWNASNASGLVIAVPGLVDVLVISGGGGGKSGTWDGSVGRVVHGLHQFAVGTHAVTVGSGGPANTAGAFGNSALGSLATGNAGAFDGYSPDGFASSITGSSVTYCLAGRDTPRANTGDSGRSTGVAGASGVVIVRVPA
jgi:hypothetical protein